MPKNKDTVINFPGWDQALDEVAEISKKVQLEISQKTEDLFDGCVDDELIAMIICNQALRGLPDLSKGRVIRFLHDRLFEELKAKKCTVEDLYNFHRNFLNELEKSSKGILEKTVIEASNFKKNTAA